MARGTIALVTRGSQRNAAGRATQRWMIEARGTTATVDAQPSKRPVVSVHMHKYGKEKASLETHVNVVEVVVLLQTAQWIIHNNNTVIHITHRLWFLF